MSDYTRNKLIKRFLRPLQLLAANDYQEVPNLLCFMERKSGNGFDYYWSYYKIYPYEIITSVINSSVPFPGINIKVNNTCHYHKHTLDVSDNIFSAFKDENNGKLYNFINNGKNPVHRKMFVEINETFEILLDARRGPSGNRHVGSMWGERQ